MNKLTKRNIAVMLSLAVVAGCNYGFTTKATEVQAAETTPISATYDVDIAWGDMQFDYEITSKTWTNATVCTNTITVTNQGSIDIAADFKFEPATGYSSLDGYFYEDDTAFLSKRIVSGNGTKTVTFMPYGSISNTEYATVGNITLTLSQETAAPTPDKYIALTFDDGVSARMGEILEILNSDKYADVYGTGVGPKATFFLVGDFCDETDGTVSETSKGYVATALNTGHELGNHSYSHNDFTEMTQDQVEEDITKMNSVLTALGISNDKMPKYFRAPGLQYNTDVLNWVNMPFVHTGLDVSDYTTKSIEDRLAKIKEGVANGNGDGEVVLMHCFSSNYKTVEALPAILDYLIAEGYKLVTVSELFEVKGVTPVNGQIYTTISAD